MISEVDHNHPDHPDKKLQKAIENIKLSHSLVINGEGALVIYVPNTNQYPPQRWHKYVESVRETFEAIFPDITIVASEYKMEFTTITKKQVFSEKLAGNIKQ